MLIGYHGGEVPCVVVEAGENLLNAKTIFRRASRIEGMVHINLSVQTVNVLFLEEGVRAFVKGGQMYTHKELQTKLEQVRGTRDAASLGT